MQDKDIHAQINWQKVDGLVPVIVQDARHLTVLMLGYMNPEALQQTLDSKRVNFYSRTKQRLWQKGETSGHYLLLHAVHLDCDQDALLVLAEPQGPTCHLGRVSCFGDTVHAGSMSILSELESVVAARQKSSGADSYTASLFAAGMPRMAQKVGEEGVEVAIAALAEDDRALAGEAADLIFHLLVLLRARDLDWRAILSVLWQRMQS